MRLLPFLTMWLMVSAAGNHLLAQKRYVAKPTIHFKRINSSNGLSQNSVYCMYQDKAGFMWLGTSDGLNLYDGTSFTVYRTNPDDSTSIPHNSIRALFEDKDGRLWVGTEDGAGYFSADRKKFHRVKLTARNGNEFTFIRSIIQDFDGNLWLSSINRGLLRYNAETGATQSYLRCKPDQNCTDSLNTSAIYQLLLDKDGSIWIGTGDAGIFVYDPSSRKFKNYRNEPGNVNSLVSDISGTLCFDQDDNIWIGSYGGGLTHLNRKTGTFTRYVANPNELGSLPSNYIDHVFQSSDGDIWLAIADGKGLAMVYKDPNGRVRFFNYKNNPADQSSLSNNSLHKVYEDRSGLIWIGTLGGGVSVIDQYQMRRLQVYKPSVLKGEGLSFQNVRSILEDDEGRLWIGYTDGGLDVASRKERAFNIFRHYEHKPSDPSSLSSNGVSLIYQDRKKNIWIGASANPLDSIILNKAVISKTPNNKEHITFKRYLLRTNTPRKVNVINTTRCIYEDKWGNIWIGGEGLYRFIPEAGRYNLVDFYKVSDLVFQPVQIIEKPNSDILIIAMSSRGVVFFDPIQNSIERHLLANKDHRKGLPHNSVRNMHLQGDSVLWISTVGSGLCRYHINKDEFQLFNTRNSQLVSDAMYSMQADDNGYLWIGTSQGLTRFNMETNEMWHLEEADGLQSKEFNVRAFYKSRQTGELFFGGIAGVNAFFSDSLQPNRNLHSPSVIITEVKVNNTAIKRMLPDLDELTKAEIKVDISANGIEYIEIPYGSEVVIEFSMLDYRAPHRHRYKYKLLGSKDEWQFTDARRPFAVFPYLTSGTYTLEIYGFNSDGLQIDKPTQLIIEVGLPFWLKWWFISLCLIGLIILVLIVRYSSMLISRSNSHKLAKQVAERTAELESNRKELAIQAEQLRLANAQIGSQNAQLLAQAQETEQINKNLRLLSEIGQRITGNLSIKQIINTSYKNINAIMKADVFAIGVHNARENVLEMQGVHDSGQRMSIFRFSLDRDDMLSVRCLKKRSEIIIRDYENEFHHYIKADAPVKLTDKMAGSIIYLPLMYQSKPMGVLTVQNYNKDAFTEQHISMLRGLAVYVAIALANADTYKQLQDLFEQNKNTQSKLIHSEKMASLGRLTAGIAHEINNPVNFMYAGANALSRNLEVLLDIMNRFDEIEKYLHEPDKQEAIGQMLREIEHLKEKYGYLEIRSDIKQLMIDIRQGASRASEIVKNLRNFSRLDKDRLTLGDIHEDIEFAITLLKVKIDKRITIVRDYDPLLPSVVSNHGQLNQVFINVIDNAIQAIEGEGTVTISTQNGINEVIISISDTGKGMEEDVKNKIFEPYFTTKDVGEGTGLGLSITFSIVQELLGKIDVQSQRNTGTTFIITLPKLENSN